MRVPGVGVLQKEMVGRGFLEDSCQRARILHMTGMLAMYLIGLFVW